MANNKSKYQLIIDDVKTYGKNGAIWHTSIGVYCDGNRVKWPSNWPSWVSVAFLEEQGCEIVPRTKEMNPSTWSFSADQQRIWMKVIDKLGAYDRYDPSRVLES